VALGYHNLARVIHEQKVDFIKAEKLIREALRIRTQLYDNDNLYIVETSLVLAQILQSQDKLGSETKKLFELSLLVKIKNYGPDGRETAYAYASLGTFYYLSDFFSLLMPYWLVYVSHVEDRFFNTPPL
jgi:hypothetical protein